ncbi:olfactory receptor 52D1-like [Discoglossus pictus]
MMERNMSSFHPDYFLLMGIPGLEDSQFLISIPFFSMYIMALVGNSLLVFIIAISESLHQPMYIFLANLAVTDLLLCSTTVPKTLTIFCLNSHEISFNGCLVQVFFIHLMFGIESGILLIMAYDRYSAICYPLKYTLHMTTTFIRRILFIAATRTIIVIIPLVLLLKRLPYQRSNIINHTYCEHMAVARLATADILVNVVYGMLIAICVSGTDMFLIATSYIGIIRTIQRLPSSEARWKAFNTCVSHICVILIFYIPAFYSFIAHRVGQKNNSAQIHILVANLYVLVPPMMNSIIYGVKTKEIRRRFLSLLLQKKM